MSLTLRNRMKSANLLESLGQIGPLARNALRRDVVVRIMTSIFQGETIAGTRLVIRKLAMQLGISATPIREALVELEAIGVVQFIHNRGAVVKPFGRQHLREIYHLRRILEAEATRCACGHIPAGSLQELKRDMRQLLNAEQKETAKWSDQVMALDRRLHELVAEHCGNTRLADEIHRYNELMQTIREIAGNQRQTQQRALEEHLPIVDSLLLMDAEKAAAAMSQHIDSTAESIVKIMFPTK